jgi:hypothetical protein
MVALAAAIGACQVAVLRGTTPLVVVSALLSFVLGLEVLEPLIGRNIKQVTQQIHWKPPGAR